MDREMYEKYQKAERLIDEQEAAELTGFSRYWFQQKRCKGGGPPFLKVGPRAVRYPFPGILHWMASQGFRRSTSHIPAPAPQ